MANRIIKKKKWSLKRTLTIAGITFMVALGSASYYLTSGKSRLNLEPDRITVAPTLQMLLSLVKFAGSS
jgi:HlyD family secretion protein